MMPPRILASGQKTLRGPAGATSQPRSLSFFRLLGAEEKFHYRKRVYTNTKNSSDKNLPEFVHSKKT